MSTEQVTPRFRVTLTRSGDRLRLEAFAQPSGKPIGARETSLPADLDATGCARALQLVARRLDRAAVRGEDLHALLDDLARVRLNRAGVVAMPRSVRRAPSAPNTNTRGDKRGTQRGSTMGGADHKGRASRHPSRKTSGR
jgi:hypothetical protein